MLFDISHGGAALAGLLSFLSPCILPVVPFYLCYLAGMSMSELRGDHTVAPGAQRRLVLLAVAFALGVTTIFGLMGMGASALGQMFAQWREPLSYVAAVVLCVFGLHFLGVLRVPVLNRDARLETARRPGGMAGAYVMGLAFGFGWTPCVGPMLTAILMMASGLGDVVQGGILLIIYGLAMTSPFVVVALFAGPFLRWVARHRHHMAQVERATGALLIVFAVLIATDSMARIADVMLRMMPWMTTLG